MSALLNKTFFSIFKYFIYPIIFLIIFCEIFFQIIFFFDIKFLKKPILFFNPYCDQSFWNYQGISTYDEKVFVKHPVLTIVKKQNKIFFENDYNNKNDTKKKLIFYGSSFIGHEYFINYFKNDINFAIKSYGIDQIYESYNLTKNNFPNRTIIIGFLHEDIDRSIFSLRNLPKLKFEKSNSHYEIKNIPISFQNHYKYELSFFTYNFFKNITFLLLNDYNYKNSYCKAEFKKNVFKYFIKNIVSESEILGQKLIFVTFNFKDDFANSNWRYKFVNDYFSSNNIEYLDALKIIKLDQEKNNNHIDYYFNNEDNHLSQYGFEVIRNAINDVIKLYK